MAKSFKLSLMFILLLAVFMILAFINPKPVRADTANGTWGTCSWMIDDAGTLTIGAGTGAVVGYGNVPWKAYSNKIINVKTSGVVALPQNSSYLFSGLKKVKTIDLPGFDTASATNMSYMFNDCPSLTSLDLSKFNTANVTNMKSMFDGCLSLTSLDLSKLNTGNVTDMNAIFADCSRLLSLNLSSLNTGSVTDMSNMFNGCSALTSLGLSSFNTPNVTNMSGMFEDCSSLTSLDLSKFNTAKVTSMYHMFHGCSSMSSLGLSSFNTGNVTNTYDMFGACSSLTSLDLSNFNTAKVRNMGYMFYNCYSLSSLSLSSFNTEGVMNMSCMFSGCSALSSLDLSSFNTRSVTNMSHMFDGCSSLPSLDMSGFNTANVKTMGEMFSGCSSLTSIGLSGFNTANVTNMYMMFANCFSLSSLDLSKFNTTKVTNMKSMFDGCLSLTSLDLSNFNTGSVTDMEYMFNSCSSMSSLDLSSFNTKSVRNMGSMFFGCSSLKSIKLGAKSGLTNKAGSTSSFRGISPKAKEGEDITYTGNWTKTSPYNRADSINGADLEAQYATNSSGFGNFEEATWVWEIKGQDPYGQKYNSDDGITDGKHNVVRFTSDTPVDKQIDSFATGKDGSKTGYWTKLDDDTWTYTFYVYKAGVPWRVYEDALSGYVSPFTEHPLTIQSGDEESVITNVSDKMANQKYGNLKIAKVLEAGSGTAPEQKFSFEITLTDENKKPLSGNTMFGSTAFSSGKANVSVSAGESTTVSGIPVGYHYNIREIPARGYRQVSFTNSSGTITDNAIEAVCTNRYAPIRRMPSHTGETVGLTIDKVCDSQTDKFKFSINISNLNAGENVAAEIKTTSASTAENTTYTPDGSGEINAEAEISGSGSISLSGIPVGAAYRITEAATAYIASYNITDAARKGLINKTESANSEVQAPLSTMTEMADSGENINITFTNKKPSYPVAFTKRDENDNFVEGAVLEVLDAGGAVKSVWTTAAGENKELYLEPGTYTLRETSAPDGYAKAADISFEVDSPGKVLIDGAEVMAVEMIDASTNKEISVKKVDDSGYPVIGARLAIKDDETGAAVSAWESGTLPQSVSLAFGKSYTLSEDTAPEGYMKAADIKLSISKGGTLTVDGKETDDSTISMVDSMKKPFLISKVNDTGDPVIGAKLALIDKDTGETAFLWTTDDAPYEAKLQSGKEYTLRELEAPRGYEKADDMEIKVSADMKLIIDGKEEAGTTIRMVDSLKPYALPSTGTESRGHLRELLYIIVLACTISLVCRKEKPN